MTIDKQPTQAVHIVNINMPFGAMVTFMVKWSLAAIPALLILAGVTSALLMVLMGLTGSLRH
jgi:hypothetical protein